MIQIKNSDMLDMLDMVDSFECCDDFCIVLMLVGCSHGVLWRCCRGVCKRPSKPSIMQHANQVYTSKSNQSSKSRQPSQHSKLSPKRFKAESSK